MELRHLRYFVAVADAMSFTRAAIKLRLAQPSLTRQIKNLEAELRVQLFDRQKNRIALTGQGTFFLERARRLLTQSALDIVDVRRHGRGEVNGSLNIGYVADLHYTLLPVTLSGFRKVWPDVALNLFDMTVAEQLRAFEKDKIDLSFVREVKLPTHAGLRREPIIDCDVMAVLPEAHPLAKGKPLRLRDLRSMPFVSLSEELYPGARQWLNRVCRQAGFTPKIAYEADRGPTMINLVALELGAALLPEACLRLPHDGTVFSPLVEPVKSRTEIVWKKRNLSAPLRHYIEIVRERFANRRSSTVEAG
jgi:DNA-binding transcriptional LysR family regulator